MITIIFALINAKSATSPFADVMSAKEIETTSTTSTTYTTYSSLSYDDQKQLFEEFKARYGREYSSKSEESQRFENFQSFLASIDENNEAEANAGGSAVFGVTKFADWSTEDLDRLGSNRLSNFDSVPQYFVDSKKAVKSSAVVNWAGVYTTPVKDQGLCDCCWAISTATQIESDAIRAGYLTTDQPLSFQQVLSCTDDSANCRGTGDETLLDGYDYVESAGGLELNSSYPYTAYGSSTKAFDGTCESNSAKNKIGLSNYSYLASEDDMETYVTSTGPVTVIVTILGWSSYTSGIKTWPCGDTPTHYVQVVGINKVLDYWIVRNNWGTDWGVDGYIYLASGNNTCKIATEMTVTTVFDVNATLED